MKIHEFLTDDPKATKVVSYGRHIYDKRDLILRHEDNIRRAAEAAGLPDYMQMYTNMAEDFGLDPYNDNVKADFLLSQMGAADPYSILRLYTYMFKHGLEPLVFEDDDIFYYIIGKVGKEIYRDRKIQQALSILEALIEDRQP